MTDFFQTIFTRYPIKTRRALEFLPGFISWMLILSPFWGSLLVPYVMAYFILFFDVYWFYRSFSLTITAYIASKKIRKAEKQDWLKSAKLLKNFNKVNHIVIIPNYKENISKLRPSLTSIAMQTFPAKRIYVVLAMEERETEAKEKAAILKREFKKVFGDIIATYHPDLLGEVKGKSSNQAFAAKTIYKNLIQKGVININYTTVSSVDADSVFDSQYFAYLTNSFLSDPKRYNKFWQSANVNYNNFWNVPAPVRIISFFGSLWRTGLLIQGDRLVVNSTYSLSFALLKKIDFWDADVIPEDYRVFFKAFYRLNGNIWVEPIFLKTSMDAPQSSGYVKSLKNKYNQERRWSWGVSDDPLFLKWWFTAPNVPFIRKTIMLYNILLDHFLWPVNWFIITIAANIMPFVNPVFSRTTLGYNLPRLAGLMLTLCLFATMSMIIIDLRNRPKNLSSSKAQQFLFPLEFILLPVVGFFLSALPALISHTQLMLGKRLEYKVTEKL
ncbi:MAG: glycosyltransferase family 2 protein [Candidatus Levybacteria bacterium]|nr:glycosyltransferase family 2 protein [Candidatus Levybacteria bacterium]